MQLSEAIANQAAGILLELAADEGNDADTRLSAAQTLMYAAHPTSSSEELDVDAFAENVADKIIDKVRRDG